MLIPMICVALAAFSVFCIVYSLSIIMAASAFKRSSAKLLKLVEKAMKIDQMNAANAANVTNIDSARK